MATIYSSIAGIKFHPEYRETHSPALIIRFKEEHQASTFFHRIWPKMNMNYGAMYGGIGSERKFVAIRLADSDELIPCITGIIANLKQYQLT